MLSRSIQKQVVEVIPENVRTLLTAMDEEEKVADKTFAKHHKCSEETTFLMPVSEAFRNQTLGGNLNYASFD